MTVLDTIVRYISASYAGKGRPLSRLLITRIISIYGISTLLFLVRLRRLRTSEQRVSEICKFSRNSSAMAIVSTSVPVLRRLTNLENSQILWSTSIGASLWTTTELPSRLASYVAVESVSETIISMKSVKETIVHMAPSSLVISKQFLLSLIVPLFYTRFKMSKKTSGATRFLFGKRSLVQDFVLFYCIWNFLSVYNSFKRFLLEKRRNKGYYPQSNSSRQVDDWPMISGNLKPLMDKLGEIHEITLHDSYSLFEKLMNSAAIKNVVPCFRWAVWRQLCVKTLHHSPPKYFVNTNLMKSITLMLGFFVLDGNNSSMDVRPGVLRYLIRCILNTYLQDTSLNVQKTITFLFSHLALYSSKQRPNYV